MEALKGVGTFALGIAVIIAVIVIAMLFFSGVAYVSGLVIPWLIDAAWIAFGILLFVMFPLSLFRGTRIISCYGFFIGSHAFGLCGWVLGFLITYAFWGFIGVVVGLFIFGIGVVPIAMLAAAINGTWEAVWQLVALIVLTFGSRAYAMHLAQKADRDAYERHTITLEAK